MTDFYEWQGAGQVDGRQLLSSMHSRQAFFDRLYFGFSLEQWYLRLDPLPLAPDETEDGGPTEVQVHVLEPTPATLRFRLDLPEPPHFTLWQSRDGATFEPVRAFNTIRRKKVIELGVPFKELGLQAGMKVQFVVSVMRGELELDRIPAHQPLAFTVPDQTFEDAMWRV